MLQSPVTPFAALEWRYRLKKFFNGVYRVQSKICAVLLLAMIVVITIQIFGRMIFKISTPWTEELSKYLLIWVSFIGGVGALIKGEHLMVDIIYNILSERLKRYAHLFNSIIYICFSGFLFYYGIELCRNPIIRKSLTPAMAMPRVWLYLILPISMGFMLLYSAYKLFMDLAMIINKTELSDSPGTENPDQERGKSGD